VSAPQDAMSFPVSACDFKHGRLFDLFGRGQIEAAPRAVKNEYMPRRVCSDTRDFAKLDAVRKLQLVLHFFISSGRRRVELQGSGDKPKYKY
jgi:hypothetical protein